MCTFKRLARKLAVYLTSLALIAVCLPVNAQAGEDASDEAGPVTAAISMEGSQAVIGVAVSDGRDFTMGLEASDLFVRSDSGFSAYDLGHQELLTAVPGQTIRVVPLEAPLAGTRADLYLNGQVEPLAAKTDVSGSGESYTYWEIPVTEDLSSIHIVNRTGQEGPRRALRAAAKGAAASGNTFYIVQGDPGISAAGQWTKTSDPNFKGSSDPNYFRNKYGAQPEFSASPKWNPSSGSPVYCANWKGGTEGLMNVTDQGSLQDNADTYNQSILADGSGDNQVLSAYWLKCMAYVLSKGFYDKNQQSVSLVWDGDTSTWGYYQAGDTITLTSQDQMWAATQWSVWALEIMGQTGHPESYQADNHTTSAAVSYRIGHVGSTMSDPAAQITLQAFSFQLVKDAMVYVSNHADLPKDMGKVHLLCPTDMTPPAGSGHDIYQVFLTYDFAPQQGYVCLKKSSVKSDITEGNPGYSLIGTSYALYDNENLSGPVKATLTVKSEDGSSEAALLDAGTYWYKEVKAGPGYRVNTFNKETDTITVTKDNTKDKPAVIKEEDQPLTDPIGILLQKVDKETGVEVRRVF